MKSKYNEMWLVKNNLTEESIQHYKNDFYESVQSCKTGKFVALIDPFWLEFILPVFWKYKFECKPSLGFLEITIYVK